MSGKQVHLSSSGSCALVVTSGALKDSASPVGSVGERCSSLAVFSSVIVSAGDESVSFSSNSVADGGSES